MEQRNATLTFRSTESLMAAMSTLRALHVFRVYNVGRSHYIEFRTTAEAASAARTLNEKLYAQKEMK